jgi:hypothetical protein
METGLNLIKKHALKIAKDLCYSEKVKEKIRNAKSENEIDRIFTSARKGEIKD